MRFAMIRDWVMKRLKRRLNLGACESALGWSQLVGCDAPGSAPRTEGKSERAIETKWVHVKGILVRFTP